MRWFEELFERGTSSTTHLPLFNYFNQIYTKIKKNNKKKHSF